MKKIGVFFLAAALAAAGLTGCSQQESGNDSASTNTNANDNGTEANGADTAEQGTAPSEEISYKPTEENVKLLGRTAYIDDVLYCAFSGTGIEFTFTGTSCSITVQGDSGSTSSSNADSHARVGIYVNGERIIDDMVDQSEEIYSVIDSETEVEATISLVKLSEAANSTFGITEIKADGAAIKPTSDKEMLVEFVGDSITCGYGVDDPDKNHHFSTKTEDVTKAYAYLTAQKLDADYSMVSLSGYGIISGYSGDGEKVAVQTLPQYYDKLGYSWSPNGSFTPSQLDWDFGKRQPDVIVVNLGTNDDSYTKADKERQEEFSAAYTEFIKQIREKNPDSKILCVFGVMGDRLYTQVENAVKRYTEETGDENVFALKLAQQSQDDGYSADWHPSVTTHEKTAEAVSEEITRLLA
ncbi:MAG: GDSL-type esterase/lipase family protein [Firmicutes bacterium]|nr:GDSL-type esterase/lipase family protein [[Eubacterium] siraeum]MCM1488348.1 GDSL-type esterase/lipase family protein [Bacillota bacterium]